LGIAALTFVVIYLVQRTKLKMFASLIGLLLASLVVFFMGLDQVQIVQDISTIPQGIPSLTLPSLSDFNFDIIISGLTLAAIIAIQGMGVSQMSENPDES